MSDEYDEGIARKNGEPITRRFCVTPGRIDGFNINEKRKLDLAYKRIQIRYGLGNGEAIRLVPRGRLFRKRCTEEGEEYYEEI